MTMGCLQVGGGVRVNRGEVTIGRERPSWFGKRKTSLCQGFDNTAGPKVRAKS